MEDGHNFFFNCFTAFGRTDASKKTGFYGKICIKACLEIEKTQVVCCSHPKNIYFRLTSTNSFHCASPSRLEAHAGIFKSVQCSTMEAVSTCQPKINILGVTAAYYLSFLNF